MHLLVCFKLFFDTPAGRIRAKQIPFETTINQLGGRNALRTSSLYANIQRLASETQRLSAEILSAAIDYQSAAATASTATAAATTTAAPEPKPGAPAATTNGRDC